MATTDERALRYIDSDGHILEPPTAMLEFAPAEYRDRIWHLETGTDGVEYSVWNGRRTPSTGLAGTAGFSDEEVQKVRNGELGYSQTRPSGWTASLRPTILHLLAGLAPGDYWDHVLVEAPAAIPALLVRSTRPLSESPTRHLERAGR